MSENLEKRVIETEALVDYVCNVINAYVTEPAVYKYAYENSEAFRRFIDNSFEETQKYFAAIKNDKRIKNFRRGLLGAAAMTTIFAPVAIVSGVSKAVKINRIKSTVGTKEFEDLFNFLAERTFEGIVLDSAVAKMVYEKANKLQGEER